jgi:hypothetical protein
MIGVCDKCRKTKKIVTHRMGVPWCATCNMQEIRDRGAATEDEHGKPMTFASGGLSQIEKWAGSTSDTQVKKDLKPVLKTLRALMIVELGGATPDEFAQVADLVRDDNPFAAVNDPGQEPLDVTFDSEGEPTDEDDTSQANGHAAEGRDAVNPTKDAKVAPPQVPAVMATGPIRSPEVKREIIQPPADQSDGAILVGISKESREELMEDMHFTSWEVDQVRLAPGLGAADEMNEALDQMMVLRNLGKKIE